MTVQEALQKIQGRDAGAVNRSAVRYAETLLQPKETVLAAVIANISTRRGHFPGIVVLTDQRVLAACGLPGIKRSVSLFLNELVKCDEANSFLNYKAAFFSKEDGFSLTVNPEIGERFSRCLAVLNGEAEEFDAVIDAGKNGILNPLLARNMLRKRRAREREQERRKAEQDAVNARFTSDLETESTAAKASAENADAVAKRLSQQLSKASERGEVTETDPLAIAARLAEELAREEESGRS